MPILLGPYNDLDRFAREKMLDEHRGSKIIITAFAIGVIVGFVVGFGL